MSPKLLVVLGSGPGIGIAAASLFASRGFDRVALLSRSADRLQSDAKAVAQAATAASPQIKTYPVDVGDATALQKTLQQVETELGAPEVVLFNAARVGPSMIGDFSPDDLVYDFKTTNVGLYVAATWAIPHLEKLAAENPSAHPCFLLSGSGVDNYPLPPLFSLCMMKSAQYSFLRSLAHTVRAKGVHVCNIQVNGVVSPEDPLLNPDNIARTYWMVYEQKTGEWEEVVPMGDIVEATKGMFQ